MSQNLISASLSAQDSADIQQHLTAVKDKLGFLSKLLPQDIPFMFKMGNTYQPFVDKAYQVAKLHPEIMPGVFDKEEFFRDYDLMASLRPILAQINELAESMQKTFTAAGSDSMIEALEVYASVKQHKDKVPGLAVISDEMAVFFKKAKTKTTIVETKQGNWFEVVEK